MRKRPGPPTFRKKLAFAIALAVPLVVLIILMYSLVWSIDRQGATLGGPADGRGSAPE